MLKEDLFKMLRLGSSVVAIRFNFNNFSFPSSCLGAASAHDFYIPFHQNRSSSSLFASLLFAVGAMPAL